MKMGWSAQMVRRCRDRYGETQLAFAARCGVTPWTISRWERVGARPNQLTRERLAAVEAAAPEACAPAVVGGAAY